MTTHPDLSSPGPIPDAPPAGPVLPGERIVVVDVLRGLAIAGVLLVNMLNFSFPYDMYGEVAWLDSPVDRWVVQGVRFFLEGKSFFLLSLLFGLGIAIQLRRREQRGLPVYGFFFRRLLSLSAIGLIHFLLLWDRDILTVYGLLGLLLLPFLRRRAKTVLVWAVLLLPSPLLLYGFLWGFSGHPEPPTHEEVRARYETQAEADRELLGRGSYSEVVRWRLGRFGVLLGTVLFDFLFVFPPMLLGIYAGMRGHFDDLGSHPLLLRRLLGWGLAIGLVANALQVAYRADLKYAPFSWGALASIFGLTVGVPALGLFYAAAIGRLARDRRWSSLAAFGRMALTNYLLQSLICTSLFYGYGLGFYGRVGAAPGIALSLALLGAQVAFSRWWMGRFRFGPVEWLWRKLAYLRW